MSYRLIVFDWDGTIIDSAATIAECIRDAARELELEVPDLERARHVIGLGLHDAMRLAVPTCRRSVIRPSSRVTGAISSRARTRCCCLTACALLSGKHLLAIATGKSRRGLDHDLDFHGLKPLFAASRCADETQPKPHPAMLQELMAELEVPSMKPS